MSFTFNSVPEILDPESCVPSVCVVSFKSAVGVLNLESCVPSVSVVPFNSALDVLNPVSYVPSVRVVLFYSVLDILDPESGVCCPELDIPFEKKSVIILVCLRFGCCLWSVLDKLLTRLCEFAEISK